MAHEHSLSCLDGDCPSPGKKRAPKFTPDEVRRLRIAMKSVDFHQIPKTLATKLVKKGLIWIHPGSEWLRSAWQREVGIVYVSVELTEVGKSLLAAAP
jgi:hypothetical protein